MSEKAALYKVTVLLRVVQLMCSAAGSVVAAVVVAVVVVLVVVGRPLLVLAEAVEILLVQPIVSQEHQNFYLSYMQSIF